MDSAIFRTIAVSTNHKPPTQCYAVFKTVYSTANLTGHFNYAIVASKDIWSQREIYVEVGGDNIMHCTGGAHHNTQPKRQKSCWLYLCNLKQLANQNWTPKNKGTHTK